MPSSSHFLLTPTLRWVTPGQCACREGSAEVSPGWTQLEALPFQNELGGMFKPLRRPWAVSQPTHCTDMETEGQSRETLSQVSTDRSSGSAVSHFSQSALGHKQVLDEPESLKKLTEKDRAAPSPAEVQAARPSSHRKGMSRTGGRRLFPGVLGSGLSLETKSLVL